MSESSSREPADWTGAGNDPRMGTFEGVLTFELQMTKRFGGTR